MKTVLYSDDINLLSHWEKAIQKDYVILDTLEELLKVKSSILVINYSACHPSCQELLHKLVANQNHVLVLHRTPSLMSAKILLKNGAKGYGNARMHQEFILSAIHTLKEGMVWLYPSFISELILEIPMSKKTNEAKLVSLTPREKEVALLLVGALAYKEIGEKLDITIRTVKAHSLSIYTKLGIKDRLALALLIK